MSHSSLRRTCFTWEYYFGDCTRPILHNPPFESHHYTPNEEIIITLGNRQVLKLPYNTSDLVLQQALVKSIRLHYLYLRDLECFNSDTIPHILG